MARSEIRTHARPESYESDILTTRPLTPMAVYPFAISGCLSLLQSLGDTSIELAMVENLEFAVGISVLSVIIYFQRYFRF